MWKCKQCGFINNNSSEKCHGMNCKALRQYEAVTLPEKLVKPIKTKDVLDYCPVCKKDNKFVYVGRRKLQKVFKCVQCHKEFRQYGKSRELPEEMI